MGQDIKRCSLRSAGSLPEGIAHPATYITTNIPCSNERGADDDSLYGTPKEEIPPFMVCITILYYKITLQKLTNLWRHKSSTMYQKIPDHKKTCLTNWWWRKIFLKMTFRKVIFFRFLSKKVTNRSCYLKINFQSSKPLKS